MTNDDDAYLSYSSELERMAGHGNSEAQYNLGLVYMIGAEKFDQDHQKAAEWFHCAANKGHTAAQSMLNCLYSSGVLAENDEESPVDWISQIGSNDAETQFVMGFLYLTGAKGLNQHYETAVQRFRRAAIKHNHMQSQALLGYMHFSGLGIDHDYAKAVQWYSRAANQGHVQSQATLGYMYASGSGVKQNYETGAQWYERAAKQSHAEAQYNLGSLYLTGERGFDLDHKQAMQWISRAAEQDHAMAQIELAQMYSDGTEITQNHSTALYWLKRANGRFDSHGDMHWLMCRAYQYMHLDLAPIIRRCFSVEDTRIEAICYQIASYVTGVDMPTTKNGAYMIRLTTLLKPFQWKS